MACSVASLYSGCRASWDTSPISKPIRPNKAQKPISLPTSQPAETATVTATVTAPAVRKEELPAAQLWNSSPSRLPNGKREELYLGAERWLPTPPKVKKPRSIYNAASLAYLGDGIYELYARRHFLYPPKSIDVYNERVMAIVRCEAQDALLKKLLSDDFLTEEERDILRWGKNVASGKTRTKKRAGVQVYSRASSLETLIGFLYLTNVKRLEDMMQRLGFSAAATASPDLVTSQNPS